MATNRRRQGKRTTGRKRPTGRRPAARRRRSSRGAREAQRTEFPRLVEGRAHPEVHRDVSPAERAVEAAPMWGTGVPGFVRQIAESSESAAAESRRRAEAAEAELRRRREELERASWSGGHEVPGLSEIGLELALGAMRLARTIATAPLRIGLAFLRPREA